MSTDEHRKEEVERLLGLPVGEPTDHHYAVTGEPYVTLTSGGVKLEGKNLEAVAFNAEKAWQMFLRELTAYSIRVRLLPSDTLYWRRPPDLDSWEMYEPFDKTDVTVYFYSARLLISAKPVVEQECHA